jgi:H+-transporting ATPase
MLFLVLQWNIKALFLVSSIMAFFSCISSLILLHFALNSHRKNSLFHAFGLPTDIPYGKIVMLMYLKVAVSDFLTLFSARTGPKWFWETMPALLLLAGATISLVATTLIASLFPEKKIDGRLALGLCRGAGGKLWPLWIWIYCIIIFLVQDAGKARRLSCSCNDLGLHHKLRTWLHISGCQSAGSVPLQVVLTNQ